MPLTKVLLDPVRSAEPPTISGTSGVIASSAAPECTRVALTGASCAILAVWARRAAKAFSGMSPLTEAVNTVRSGESFRRLSHLRRSRPPRLPAFSQASATSSGRVKGSWFQPMAVRAAAISGSNRE